VKRVIRMKSPTCGYPVPARGNPEAVRFLNSTGKNEIVGFQEGKIETNKTAILWGTLGLYFLVSGVQYGEWKLFTARNTECLLQPHPLMLFR